MQVKRLFCLMLCAFSLLEAQPATTRASTVAVVALEPSSCAANINETFTVNVTVRDVQNLYSVGIDLYWNPYVLGVTNIDLWLGVESHPDGVLHESTSVPNPPYVFIIENKLTQEQGKYVLSATSAAPASSFNGSGSIVRITFIVIVFANSTLNLVSSLYDRPPPDGWSSPIQHVTIDGSFVAIPEFPSMITLLAFMDLLVMVAVFSKKLLKKKVLGARHQRS